MRAGFSMGTSTSCPSMPGHLWDQDTYTCLAQSHLEPHPHPQSLGLIFYDLRLSPSEPPFQLISDLQVLIWVLWGLWAGYPPFLSFFYLLSCPELAGLMPRRSGFRAGVPELRTLLFSWKRSQGREGPPIPTIPTDLQSKRNTSELGREIKEEVKKLERIL